MIAEKLRKAILQAAMQGKLTEKLPEDGDARDLLAEIQQEKQRKIEAGEIKATKPLPPVDPDEIPFEIPPNWVWTRLGNITNYGLSPQVNKADIPIGSWIIELEDIEKDSARLLSYRTDRIPGSSKIKFQSGDVLYGKLRPYLRKVIVANQSGFCSSEIIPFRGYAGILSSYLMFFMLSPFTTFTVNNKTFGTKMPRAGTEQVKSIIVPLAPKSEQNRLVEALNRLLSICDVLDIEEKELDALEREFPDKLKKSLLQAAMLGKFTEQLPEDGDARDLLTEIRQEKKLKINTGEIKAAKPLPPIDPEEIPYEIPENWVWTRLDSVSGITMGQSPPGNSVNITDGVEFHQGKIHFGNVIIGKSKYRCTQPKKEAEPGSVLLCVRAPVGIVNLTDRHICIGRGLASLLAFNKIDSFYLFYYLQTRTSYFEAQATGSTFKAINLGIITNSLLALPPLNEQRRIVSVLDKLLPLCERLMQP
jgi:type I restriction enzyme S subunit